MLLAADRRWGSELEEGRPFLGVVRSLGGRRWIDRLDQSGALAATAIAQRLDMPELAARVLAGRGVTVENAAAFLDPSLKRLMPDPSTLTDMDAAAARIADAVVRGEPVAIFGDYDVDGAASSALLARFLRHQGLDPRIYIPDRLFEGYGPNPEAMRSLAAAGARLVVAVDCGSTSLEAIAAGRAAGLDVVVLDHHQLGAELPQAMAVVNPNRADDLSGLGNLAAAGVTFLAVVAVNRELRRRGWYGAGRKEPELLQWLDLVALGTICDVVPLTGLNRAFVVKGIAALRRGDNRGLAALAAAARLDGPMSVHHLGYMLGPRINAGGRIGDAGLGARLLSLDDDAEAIRIAAELDRLNGERQAIETVMLAEAAAEAEAEIGSGEGPAVLVAGRRGWHAGVAGIAAARLKERFRRPAFVIAFGPDGTGTGSGRSIAGVDLGRAVRGASEAGILVKGGGHAMAAGITLEEARLGDFRAYLAVHLSEAVRLARSSGGLKIDTAMTARSATPETIELIERAGPFGAGHPEPLFAFPSHRVTFADIVGNGHVRLSLATEDGAGLKAIAFRAAETDLGRALLAGRGQPFHLAGTLSVEHWQQSRRVTLRVVDAAMPTRG